MRLYTKTWPYYRTRPFTEFWEVSIEHLRLMWHSDRGRSSGQVVPSQLGLASVLLVETNSFPELVVIFPDHALRTSLGTFSILLPNLNLWVPLSTLYLIFSLNQWTNPSIILEYRLSTLLTGKLSACPCPYRLTTHTGRIHRRPVTRMTRVNTLPPNVRCRRVALSRGLTSVLYFQTEPIKCSRNSTEHLYFSSNIC